MDIVEAFGVTIRPELPEDCPVISKIIQEAFTDHPYSKNNEAEIVSELRRKGDLKFSFVAESSGQVFGHIAFSPVELPGYQQWYALGPLAVRKNLQKKGVGSLLVTTGLSALRRQAAKGCVVFGSPLFYGKFGFAKADKFTLNGESPPQLMALAFDSVAPSGEFSFHPAFYV